MEGKATSWSGWLCGGHCNESRVRLYRGDGGGNLEQSLETLDQCGCYVECMNVNNMKMQTFILHGLTGYAVPCICKYIRSYCFVFLMQDNFHLHVDH